MSQQPPVPGLIVVARYLPDSEQSALTATIDALPWITDLKRRVQHYGYRYDYKSRSIDRAMYLGPLPGWAAALADRLHAEGHAPICPDQLIVNEYQPGQGIAPHVDCTPCFGDTIISISLGSACVMEFRPLSGGQPIPFLLQPGSMLVMQGEARMAWKHGIPARKSDVVGGETIARGRRLSLTFRQVLPAA